MSFNSMVSESVDCQTFFGESGWAQSFFGEKCDGLEFVQEPENCLDEFVTAVPLPRPDRSLEASDRLLGRAPGEEGVARELLATTQPHHTWT